MAEHTESHGDDPNWRIFDEAFVRGAAVSEPSAAERHQRAQDAARLRARHPARAAKPPRPARPKRGAPNSSLVLIVVATVLIAGLAWRDRTNAESPLSYANIGDGLSLRHRGERPSGNAERRDSPYGIPPVPAVESSRYKFIATQPKGSDPVAYDPCLPIHLVVNTRTMPAGSEGMLEAAIDEVRTFTGLRLVIDGPTDEAYVKDRSAFQRKRYGNRWAPVLVAWSDPQETPGLDGRVAGLGGSVRVQADDSGRFAFVSGVVVLDGPTFADILLRPSGWDSGRAIITHELGHLVGLAHFDDTSQLMDPTNTGGVTHFAEGDQAGLARLGAGRCFKQI